ncbi:jupiter microtubule associated homolog 1 isoform 2-T2 [Amazona ochrocephala]
MTTTTTFSGMDPSGRSSSRVLRPPGGGSNFSLGFDEPKEQPVRRNKMASSIFGTPEENPPSWAKSSGTKPGESGENCESSGPQRRNSTDANCGDFVDPKGGDGGGETSVDLDGGVMQQRSVCVPGLGLPSSPEESVCLASISQIREVWAGGAVPRGC